MKVANISTTKNSLSRILAEVRAGETYLIIDRDVAIARIEPLAAVESQLSALAADGSVALPPEELDLARFSALPKPGVKGRITAVSALLEERASGR